MICSSVLRRKGESQSEPDEQCTGDLLQSRTRARQTSSENRGQPSLTGAPEWVVLSETLVELRERRVLALQENPFEVDELGVLPHPDSNLPLEIELVLRCDRQALECIECPLVKLSHHGHDQDTATRPRRRNPEGKLQPIASHCLQCLSDL